MSKLLSSLQNILNTAIKTGIRFPLEIITAILGTIFAIILNEINYNNPYKNFYYKALMSSSLCLVLFLSVSLFFLASKKNNLLRFLTSLVLGTLIVLFVFSFHKYITEVEVMEFFVLNIVLHLLVSFAGFLPKTYNQDEFWEFNKQLFLRILTAGFYSTVIYCGLALAILAINKLFNFEFYDHIYLHIFFVIAGIFNTTFFLSGVPEINTSGITLALNYPKGLKNFVQYVLIPLISLYLVILICYEIRIIVTLSLPVGWVSNLVLVFAIIGILSFLLVHPIATETSNLWMKTFNRWFYFLLIPLLGLLFWAILYRINLYGFTHERYYVLLLSIWLAVVVGYFLISKHQKIKFIPISLCLAGLFSIAGPQSANSISKNSQLSRFESYLQKAESKKLTFEQEKDLSSIVDFITYNYNAKVLLPYTKNKLNALLKKEKEPSSFLIMEALGFNYFNKYDASQKDISQFSFYYSERNVQNIHGYDITFDIYEGNSLDCNECLKINNISYSIEAIKEKYGLNLQINQDKIPLNLVDFINNNYLLFGDKDGTGKRITQVVESPKYSILIVYLSANGKKEANTIDLNNYQIRVMIKIKN